MFQYTNDRLALANTARPALADEGLLAFTPVPLDRKRSNGWTPAQQERFILALHVMGSARHGRLNPGGPSPHSKLW